MLKALHCLFFIVASEMGIPGQGTPLNIEPGISIPDTVKLNRLIHDIKREEAAEYLSRYLNSQANMYGKEYEDTWLELAIFSAWSGKITEGYDAYSKYKSIGSNCKGSSQQKANQLLYKSLYLSSVESINQAADSLTASILIRPVNGTLNRMLLADSYGLLARLYKKTGDLFESSRNFDRSISLNRKIGRSIALAEDLSDLSSVLSTMNQSDKRADSVLIESLSIYNSLDSLSEVAQVLNELGVLFNRRQEFEKSLNYFKQSLREKTKIPGLGKQDYIVGINNIGHCYQNLGRSDSARFYFSKAVNYAILSGRNPAPYYANLGANYGGGEDYTKAIENFQRALCWLDSTCSITELSTNPRISKATPQLAEFTAFKAHSYHRRYNQRKNPEDLVNGLKTFLVALEMMDTLRYLYSFDSKPYHSAGAKIHFFNALDMAMDLYDLTGEKKYLELAFQLSERNKSATLNEFIRINQAREYMGSLVPWIKQEDSIKLLINKLESRIITLSANPARPADSTNLLRSQISGLTDELKNIGIKARKENPEYFQRVYCESGYLPADIQRLIRPGEALADYTIVHDNRLELDYMVIIILTKDTLFTYRDTLPKQFRYDIGAFRATITSYVDSKKFLEFCRLSNLMYQCLFKPVEKFKGISQLIILPDEELGFLPFEIFVTDTVKPKGSDFRKLSYLNRKYQISYISSQEQFHQFRSKPENDTKSAVYVFAPFVSRGARIDTLSLLSLSNSGNEIKFISKYFRTKIYKDRRADENSLRQVFQRKSVISLSTHGVINTMYPMQSRLLLDPAETDGSLYLFEMMSLKIKSSLVILNACNTGMGKLQVGEGIMSMARGFQFAGVPTVITSLWPIDDQSSATVMKFFFENIHEGMDQRAALMKARNSYIDQANRATGAPYFWAGQVLIGDPGTLSLKSNSINLKILVAAMLAGILITVLFIKYFKKRGSQSPPLDF